MTKCRLFLFQLFCRGSCLIRAFSDVEKPFLISDLAVKAAKSENKRKAFQRQKPYLISDLAVKAAKSENKRKAFQRQRRLGLEPAVIQRGSRGWGGAVRGVNESISVICLPCITLHPRICTPSFVRLGSMTYCQHELTEEVL